MTDTGFHILDSELPGTMPEEPDVISHGSRGVKELGVSLLKRAIYTCTMEVFDGIINDRGSKYAVSGGAVTSKPEALAFLKQLKRQKKFAKATHNTWACLLDEGPLKNDDGESGAGMVIVRMLEREELRNHIVVVTRWYGGTKLGGDRFRRVQDAVNHYLKEKT